MTGAITVDVSEFQTVVTDAYPHDVLSIRVDTGWRTDYNAKANWKWAKAALKSGRLRVLICYVVMIPGQGAGVLARVKSLLGRKCPDGVVFMIDMESGAGFAGGGNHSTEANRWVNDLATYAGSAKRVIGYANGGDWSNNWPNRPSAMRTIVASYGSVQPSMRNMIGWQYSDGDNQWPVPSGLPRSSAPFGHCDHNVFPGLTSTQLAAELGLTSSNDLLEWIMTLPGAPKGLTYQKLIHDVQAAAGRGARGQFPLLVEQVGDSLVHRLLDAKAPVHVSVYVDRILAALKAKK